MPRQSKEIPRVCEYCHRDFVQLWTARNPHLVKRFCSIACRNLSRVVPLIDRIKRRLGPPEVNGCIIWPGGTNGDGRAIIKAFEPKKVMVLVSRSLWEAECGPIPDGLGVLHTCDNPRCVNIDHFFLGTQADNIADMIGKGRHKVLRGEQCHSAKLTEESVRELRRRIAAGELSVYQAAREYGIGSSSVQKIVLRRSWKHI